MAVGLCWITRRRVQFATWEADQQSSWFQQERSAQRAGPPSTPDIWSPISLLTLTENAAATFAWMRHQKLLLGDVHRTMRWSSLIYFPVEVFCGTLPCSLYPTGKELTCIVCSKWQFSRLIERIWWISHSKLLPGKIIRAECLLLVITAIWTTIVLSAEMN